MITDVQRRIVGQIQLAAQQLGCSFGRPGSTIIRSINNADHLRYHHLGQIGDPDYEGEQLFEGMTQVDIMRSKAVDGANFLISASNAIQQHCSPRQLAEGTTITQLDFDGPDIEYENYIMTSVTIYWIGL